MCEKKNLEYIQRIIALSSGRKNACSISRYMIIVISMPTSTRAIFVIDIPLHIRLLTQGPCPIKRQG